MSVSLAADTVGLRTLFAGRAGARRWDEQPANGGGRDGCRRGRPSDVRLTPSPGASFLLPEAVWAQYDWGIQHCVLRSSNEPIRL